MTEQQQQQDFESDYAPGWRPTPGDQVQGKVTNVEGTVGFNGKPYAVVTIEQENGQELAIHAFHTVLRRELAQRRIKVGDDLSVKYLGKKGDGGSYGRGYDVYRVRGGETGGYDWSQELDDEDVQASSNDVPITPTPVPAPVTVAAPATPAPQDDDGSDLPF